MFDTWETMLRLIHSEKLDIPAKLDRIIADKTYKLTDYESAFNLLASGEEMKLVFEP